MYRQIMLVVGSKENKAIASVEGSKVLPRFVAVMSLRLLLFVPTKFSTIGL
jgi:hypothetical protein